MFRKLLCPIDFSPASDEALQFAARMAKDLDADLVVAHAWYVPPLAYTGESMLIEGLDTARKSSERLLADAKQQALAYGAPRVSTSFITGVPWAAIAELTQAQDIDLVVIGTHGRTGMSRFLLGSVAERVVRHAECSVLVARGAYKGFHHVVCAVDFSDPSRHAMHAAGELARESVTLFHSIEIPSLYGLFPGRTDDVVDYDRRARILMHEWEHALRSTSKATVAVEATFGSPAAEALQLLDRDSRLDLIVVGSHGRTGIRRVLLGSVAEKIVRHARASVLVARTRG